jgi:hypothetical protein
MNINIDLIENLIIEKKTNKSVENNIENTFICLYDFFCINNIKISEKIKEKYSLLNKYQIINTCTSITIGEVFQQIYQFNMNDITNSKKYVLLEYNKLNFTKFDTFLFNLPNPKLFIFYVIDSYIYLLNSLLELEHINVCFFNLSSKNILFGKNDKPILTNFETCLLLENNSNINANAIYLCKIIEKIEDYTHKPIEIHVIFYLIKNNEDTLTFSSIESICENFVKNISILDFFSQNYKENYYKACVDCLKKYINIPKIDIINAFLQFSNTWDNYSLSILYLHIIVNTTRCFMLKGTFLNKLSIILSKIIIPNALLRETLTNTIHNVNVLFYEFNDWEYIKLIPKEKMQILYESL